MRYGVVKRIHLLSTLFAGIVVLANTFLTFFRGETIRGLLDLSVVMPAAVFVVFLVLYFFLNPEHVHVFFFVRYLHIGLLFSIAVISTLEVYSSVYGIGFFFLGGYLAMIYGLVSRKRRVLAITIYFLAIIIIVEFSALTAPEDKRGVAIDVIAFLAFFYMILITLDTYRVKDIIFKNRELKSERDALKTKYHTAADMDNFIDLSVVLSKRQLEVAELIYSGESTDKENAAKLGISINTYRNHLKDIRQILGVSTKVEILTKVRPYFLAKAEPSMEPPADRDVQNEPIKKGTSARRKPPSKIIN